MPNLLSEFSKQSPSQSEPAGKSSEEHYSDVDSKIPGLRLSIPTDKGSSLTVAIGGRALLMASLVPVIYIFAGETGNQWFYLLAGGAVAALFLGFFLPMLQVLDINAQCSVPASAVNNENVLVKVALSRRWNLGFLSSLVPVKWLLLRSNLANHLGLKSVVRPLIVRSVEGESWVFAATAPLKRGIYRFESIELWSSFPFGLLWWCRKIDSLVNTFDGSDKPSKPLITVYPRLEQVDGNFLYKIRSSTDSPMGLTSSRNLSLSASSSVRGLREFAHGDSPRLIHWPSSARTGRLLVREFETEGLPGFDLVLNMTAPWRSEEQFELAVSVIFSLLHLGFRLGGSPELYLLPNLDIEPSFTSGFLKDLPALPSGLTRSSHLLARVKQMPDRTEFQGIDLQETSQQALLTVRPAKQFESEWQAEIESDRSLLYKVELAVIPRNIEQLSNKTSADVHMPVHEMGTVNRRAGGNPFGRVIATLEQLEEAAQL